MSSSLSDLRVGILDADSGFVRVLTKRLDSAGWEHRVMTGAVPAAALVSMRLHALVVDPAMLAPRSWELLEEYCDSLPGLGVIVCTGPSSVAQRVRGLRLGADDWVTKPCHPEEIVARVESVTRRRRRAAVKAQDGPLTFGELEIRAGQYQAFAGGRNVGLTRREFELLQVLADAGGQVIEREDVYQRVWGYAMARGDRSVDVFVRKVRQKIKAASPRWSYIHTHFGIGYRFEAEPLAGAREELAAADVPVEVVDDLEAEAVETTA